MNCSFICENCGIKHDGSYGSSRFCNCKCARGYSTKKDRLQINKKISLKLKGKPTHRSLTFTKSQCHRGGIRTGEKKRNKILNDILNMDFDELSKTYGDHILKKRIFEEQNNSCNICKIENWMSLPIVFHLHHKDANRQNKKRENLEVICPNCHSQTNNFGFKKRV